MALHTTSFLLPSDNQAKMDMKNSILEDLLGALFCLLWRFRLLCTPFLHHFHIKACEVPLQQRMDEPVPVAHTLEENAIGGLFE
jgi:hypothetical protein